MVHDAQVLSRCSAKSPTVARQTKLSAGRVAATENHPLLGSMSAALIASRCQLVVVAIAPDQVSNLPRLTRTGCLPKGGGRAAAPTVFGPAHALQYDQCTLINRSNAESRLKCRSAMKVEACAGQQKLYATLERRRANICWRHDLLCGTENCFEAHLRAPRASTCRRIIHSTICAPMCKDMHLDTQAATPLNIGGSG